MKFKTLTAMGALMLASNMAYADITIATVGPMTGPYASFGAQMKAGAEQAIKDINAAGGINGEKVVLEVGDDACDPKQAVAVANQLVNKGVSFVAGHFCSGSSIPASDVYEEEGVIQISPASTNPALTEAGKFNVFRVCGRDDQQGQIAGEYLLVNFKCKKIAIVHDKQAYSKGLANETKKTLNAGGIEEAMYDTVTPGEKDYSALVTDEYWSITGDDGEGTLMTFGPDPRKLESAKDAVATFEAAGINPEGYTLYTYAAIQAYKDAVEAAGGTDPEAVEKALKDGEFQTVIGNLTFNDKGDIEQPAYVFYEWSKGAYSEM